MGILAGGVELVRRLRLKPGFSVVELGDQWITQGERRLAKNFYVEDLRAGKYLSIDGNGRGDLIADLNLPLPKLGQFDLVTDFGTGEHVFNQWQVFRSIHYLVRQGGFFVFDRPSQGYEEHCYWLMNKCVIEDFATVNEYDAIFLQEATTSRGRLLRGALRKLGKGKFITPQQGRYRKLLKPMTGIEGMQPIVKKIAAQQVVEADGGV